MSDDRSQGDGPTDGGSEVSLPDSPPSDPDIDDLLDHLEGLERTVDSTEEREQVQYALRVARRIPGTRYLEAGIQKYTTRDVAEAFVGAILLALPMLVEDGVFEIASFLAAERVAGVPVFLVGNVVFVVLLTVGLLYWADFREIEITRPIFGIVPRRLVGVLTVTLLTTTGLVFLWGRHLAGDPTRLELFARITVIWAAAAIGGALGDILRERGPRRDHREPRRDRASRAVGGVGAPESIGSSDCWPSDPRRHGSRERSLRVDD